MYMYIVRLTEQQSSLFQCFIQKAVLRSHLFESRFVVWSHLFEQRFVIHIVHIHKDPQLCNTFCIDSCLMLIVSYGEPYLGRYTRNRLEVVCVVLQPVMCRPEHVLGRSNLSTVLYMVYRDPRFVLQMVDIDIRCTFSTLHFLQGPVFSATQLKDI